MKPLSIDKALRLYMMLSPYLPDVKEIETGLEYVGDILQSMIDDGHPRIYLEAVALMMDATIDDVTENLNKEEILDSFADGLMENKIFDLEAFCKKVGLNG